MMGFHFSLSCLFGRSGIGTKRTKSDIFVRHIKQHLEIEFLQIIMAFILDD